MKLHSIARYILALIDSHKSCRSTARRHLRSFRAEFLFQRPSKRWAASHFKRYLGSKADAEMFEGMLREQFGKLVKVITFKPRFTTLEVAA